MKPGGCKNPNCKFSPCCDKTNNNNNNNGGGFGQPQQRGFGNFSQNNNNVQQQNNIGNQFGQPQQVGLEILVKTICQRKQKEKTCKFYMKPGGCKNPNCEFSPCCDRLITIIIITGVDLVNHNNVGLKF